VSSEKKKGEAEFVGTSREIDAEEGTPTSAERCGGWGYLERRIVLGWQPEHGGGKGQCMQTHPCPDKLRGGKVDENKLHQKSQGKPKMCAARKGQS